MHKSCSHLQEPNSSPAITQAASAGAEPTPTNWDGVFCPRAASPASWGSRELAELVGQGQPGGSLHPPAPLSDKGGGSPALSSQPKPFRQSYSTFLHLAVKLSERNAAAVRENKLSLPDSSPNLPGTDRSLSTAAQKRGICPSMAWISHPKVIKAPVLGS